MDPMLIAITLIAALFFGMLAMIEAGRRVGQARLARDPSGLARGNGAAEAAVFGLLGLLIAFTFSSAAARFQERKQQITQEANAIGTAYLRMDLVAPAAQAELRDLMRRYADMRIVTYSNVIDVEGTRARLAEGSTLQSTIWTKALGGSAAQGASPDAAKLLVPALNDMFDITTTRVMATRNHSPAVVYLLLVTLCLVGALLIGYELSGSTPRPWLHPLAFSAALTLCVYVIIDLEFPRLGFIHINEADQILVEVRQSMR
jgi:hypothetical protein